MWCTCTHHIQLLATPWPVAHQVLRSMGFPRQECWSGLPFLPSGDLPNPGTKPASPVVPALQADSLPAEPLGKPHHVCKCLLFKYSLLFNINLKCTPTYFISHCVDGCQGVYLYHLLPNPFVNSKSQYIFLHSPFL